MQFKNFKVRKTKYKTIVQIVPIYATFEAKWKILLSKAENQNNSELLCKLCHRID